MIQDKISTKWQRNKNCLNFYILKLDSLLFSLQLNQKMLKQYNILLDGKNLLL